MGVHYYAYDVQFYRAGEPQKMHLLMDDLKDNLNVVSE